MTESLEMFSATAPEGPFAFKVSRDQPIGLHFDRFRELSPEQTIELLAVRDGARKNYVIGLPGERILAEYAGTGYVDEVTNRSWGYTIRRVRVSGESPVQPQNPLQSSPDLTRGINAHDSHSATVHPANHRLDSISPLDASNYPLHSTPILSTAEATDPAELLSKKYEQELQDLRLDALKHKIRSDQLEQDLRAMRDQLSKVEAGLVASQEARSELQHEHEAIKNEKSHLDRQIIALKTELSSTLPHGGRDSNSLIAASTAARVAGAMAGQVSSSVTSGVTVGVHLGGQSGTMMDANEHSPTAHADLDMRNWLAEKEKFEKERHAHAEALEKLASEQIAVEALLADLHAREQDLAVQIQTQQQTWVAPHAYGTREKAPSNDAATAVLIRICICWFITLMLLVQCVRLSTQEWGGASTTTSSQQSGN